MGGIEVDADGLQALANECDRLSDELAVPHASQTTGPAFQATTSAVNVIDTSISVAAAKLARRMSATAGKLAQSATNYASRDTSSAEGIRNTVI